MDRSVAERPIGCRGRTHLVVIHGHILRWRCRERTCPECRLAKQRGLWAHHLFDQDTGHQWTEFTPAKTGKE